MDITTICKVIIVIGILQTCSLYHDAVDGILFHVPEMVEWLNAEQTCQKHYGKLFKPNETSFDVSLFSKCNVNDDLWVAATYIKLMTFESASRQPDSVIRCEMCTIEERCETNCLYKACGNRCGSVCKALFEPHKLVLFETLNNWTEARGLCFTQFSDLVDKIQNASSLFFNGGCNAECVWSRNVIQVQLQTEIAQGYEPDECGILHNGTISFTSCDRHLHPLCETVGKSALETPSLSFSEGDISCELMNNTTTYTTTTEAPRITNRINATVITSSTYGTSTVAIEIAKHTTIGLNAERSSLLVPVGATTSRNDLEDTPHKSDTGIIIGSVIGSVVFLILTVLVIICVRRKVLQRTGKRKSKQNQRQDVPLESESGSFAQLESKCEGSHSDIVRQKSNPGKSAYTIDPEEGNFNYATVNEKENVNSSNLTININYVSYDHLNDIRERRDDNVAVKVYDNLF